MQNGDEGFYQKAPAYVLEKYSLIHNAYVIYNMLHMNLRPHVIAYGDAWGMNFKKFVEKMDKDIKSINHYAFENKYTWRE